MGGMSSQSVDMLKCQLGSGRLTLARKPATRLNDLEQPHRNEIGAFNYVVS
jgi:hypothetical protein